MSTIVLQHAQHTRAVGRFYRPELDVLRFLAFGGVFLTHGPRFSIQHGLPAVWNQLATAGVYGLSLFFFLSSFLITELLLREGEQTGSIHRRSFYIRRILRIWPLYYLGVGLGILFGWLRPEFRMSSQEILYLLTFFGYLGHAYAWNPAFVLWSISVEELFYVLWPQIANWGKRVLLLSSFLLIPIALVTAALIRKTWENPLVEFLFFAVGALVALFLHGKSLRLPNAFRISLAIVAVGCYLVPAQLSGWPHALREPFSYLIVALGCICLFLCFLGMDGALLPQSLIYLGRISYGLYVFHMFFYRVAERLVHHYFQHAPELVRILLTYSFTLGGTILVAVLSYQYYEKPFLRWKVRYTLVKSRD
jgi:peptidoglycan/LPS O-acetylase OafA/YrhL